MSLYDPATTLTFPPPPPSQYTCQLMVTVNDPLLTFQVKCNNNNNNNNIQYLYSAL